MKKGVEDRINREIEITKLADPFLSAFRKTVRSLQGRVAGHATDADVAQNANALKAAYETLERDFGSLTQLVQRTRGSASSAKSSRASDRSVRAAAWPWPWKVQGAPRGVEELARASGSICCQINMSCESDTVDCGTLDLCENDQCGVGDSDSPCRVYDSGGCQCKIEDT